jgi:hypothetical protein
MLFVKPVRDLANAVFWFSQIVKLLPKFANNERLEIGFDGTLHHKIYRTPQLASNMFGHTFPP